MQFEIDDNFRKFLESNSSRSIICAILNHHGSEYLNISEINWVRKSIIKDDMISYLPVKKYEYYKKNDPEFDPFTDGLGRMQVKAGKFVNKILRDHVFSEFNINDAEIEKFVNILKSDSHKYEGTSLRVVEGNNINKYYSDKNYFMTDECGHKGTIWSSCMRGDNMYRFFDIYSDNAKMLVLFSKDELVMSRALLWEAIDPFTNKSYKVMDRVYYYEDSDIVVLHDWAKENGYITRSFQDSQNYDLFQVDGVKTKLELQIPIVINDYESYPYFDTFKFFCRNLKCLRNFDRLGYTYRLVQTNGEAEEYREPACSEEDTIEELIEEIAIAEPVISSYEVYPDCITTGNESPLLGY